MEDILLGQILQQPFQTLILSGSIENILSSIGAIVGQRENIDIYNHGDISVFKNDSLTIDLAREVKHWTEGMPQYRERKLLILAPTLFPQPSQNTLLKTLEEPSGNTQIILIVKDVSILLPTILSRAVVYNFTPRKEVVNLNFLKLAPALRLSSEDVQLLLKTGTQKPTKEQVTIFFDDLTHVVLQAPYSEKEKMGAVKVLTTVTPYIYDQGASVKMLVEYICLQIPVLKS